MTAHKGTEKKPFRKYLAILAAVLCSGCLSFPVIRDARTLPPGQNCFYVSVSGEAYEYVVTQRSAATVSGKSIRESGVRTLSESSVGYIMGLTDGWDVTALFRRFGEFGAELKHRFWSDPAGTQAFAATLEAYTLPPTVSAYSGSGLSAGLLATRQFGQKLSFTAGLRAGRTFFDDSKTSYNPDLYGFSLWFGEATLTSRIDLTEALSVFLTGGVRTFSPSTFSDQVNTVSYGNPFVAGLGLRWTAPENLLGPGSDR